MGNSLARRRINLMKDNPFCHWCGKKLSFPKKKMTGGRPPIDYPTIDHLYSKEEFVHGKRFRLNDKKIKGIRVLSCPACNVSRAASLQQRYIFLTRWKSGTFPFPFRWFGALLRFIRRVKRN